jgi:hypothetical protein
VNGTLELHPVGAAPAAPPTVRARRAVVSTATAAARSRVMMSSSREANPHRRAGLRTPI